MIREGFAEHVISQIIDGEAIDLAHDHPIGVDQNRSVIDHLLDLFLDQIHPVDLLLNGLIHMFLLTTSLPSFSSPVVGLPQEVGDEVKACRKLLLPSRHSHPILHHRGDPRLVEGLQFLLVADLPNKRGILVDLSVSLFITGVEVCFDLENLLKIIV